MRVAIRRQPNREPDGDGAVAALPAAGPNRTIRRASRGQIIILFAGALIGLIGLLGLGSDLGYAFVERRTMQNAADAGAIAGAHTLSKSMLDAPLTVMNDVRETAQANRIGSDRPDVTHCQYVDDDNHELGSCSIPAPPDASGVSVTVKETHNTFFVRLLPGGPKTLSTKASAIAHVQTLKKLPSDGPFLVCGRDTDVIQGYNGRSLSIAIKDDNGNWIINPDANGVTFEIHGPQISRCGLHSSDFKGVSFQRNNEPKQIPDWFDFTNGDEAGPVEQSVLGIDGCQAGQAVNNCVAFLPIAVTSTQSDQDAHPNQLYTVLIAPFYVYKPDSGPNSRNYGILIGDYVVDGEGKPGWEPGQQQPIVIRLTK